MPGTGQHQATVMTTVTYRYVRVCVCECVNGGPDLVCVKEACLWWQKMISPSNWPFKKNHCIWTTIHASVVSFNRQNYFGGLYWQNNNFFVQFWTKNFASSRMANCGSGLPAEWPFRSQNAIEASDSPLPGGLWIKVQRFKVFIGNYNARSMFNQRQNHNTK